MMKVEQKMNTEELPRLSCLKVTGAKYSEGKLVFIWLRQRKRYWEVEVKNLKKVR